MGPMPAWVVSFGRWAAVTLALGVIFAWFGVYETYQIPMPERVAYWTGLMALGVISSIVVTPLVFNKWLPRAHLAVQIAVVSAIVSAPITIGLIILESIDGSLLPVEWWFGQYGYVIVVSALLTTGAWAVDRLMQKPLAPPPAAPGAGPPAFTERLPVRLRSAELYAIESEDHYLRVHTSAGQELILMRLADAVRELAGVEGLQTHRSWWVARQGLADVVKGDGKLLLKLKSGAEAPVSRTYAKAVKEAGWN
jgi:hypothetical protein